MKAVRVLGVDLLITLLTLIGGPLPVATAAPAPVTLLNVSYDPTREFYSAYNAAFSKFWLAKTGQTVTVQQSHGGSGKQAMSIINGLSADIVTLALAYDIDAIVKQSGLIAPGWAARLPDNSCPYTSTIVFLVRKGNPKSVKDWDDLARPGVSVITPNPKTSGGARWNYLAAWGYALRKNKNDARAARDFVAGIFRNVPVLDAGARGSAITFTERGMGDVLVGWENEAMLAAGQARGFEIVVPSLSILAEPPVALVNKVSEKNGNTEVAKAYLKYLYEEEAQVLAAKNYYRPRSKSAAAKAGVTFPKVKTFSLKEIFKSWETAQKEHFSDGGTFDGIYKAGEAAK
ncbi:MAG: sulfate ABC transporter substrate-binding protein [Elusimicrobiota bacterium]|nr:sulfate ABC transporter substrate-binding protein [Elusimicrobiota bacterium]